MNELDRIAKERAQQSEAEQRAAEKREFDQRQSQALATAAEIRRKTGMLLKLLQERGAPDAEIVVITEQVRVGRISQKVQERDVEMAAWLLFSTSRGFETVSRHYLLADGQFGLWKNMFFRVPPPPRCTIVPAGSDLEILRAIERLIGKYS